jgi:GT2 family glycosyltransferase
VGTGRAERLPVTIVIVTRDRRDTLLSTLGRLGALPERPPVIVVDNGSSDGTPEAVSDRHPRVELVQLARDAGAAARNAGVERARTSLVAFCDDDSWWAPGALAQAEKTMEARPGIGLLAARVLVGPQEHLDPTCLAMERTPLPGGAILGFVACGAVVRRDAFLEAGGFDARYGIGGEEAPFAVRVASEGWGLRYAPEVVAHHHPAPSASRAGRDARALRNDLWTAWRVRPVPSALAVSARLLRTAGWRRSTLAGAAAAVRGAGWALRDRRPAPPAVEAGLRLLERERIQRRAQPAEA